MLRLEFKTFVNAFVRLPVPDYPQRPQAGVPSAGLESLSTDLLPPGGRVALLTARHLKSESGCSDPRWLLTRPAETRGDHGKTISGINKATQLKVGQRESVIVRGLPYPPRGHGPSLV